MLVCVSVGCMSFQTRKCLEPGVSVVFPQLRWRGSPYPSNPCSLITNQWGPYGSLETDLASEPKDALDVAGQAALALLLHLVVEGREGHVVQRQVEEEGLTGDWLEVRWELDQIGLLSDEGGVQAEGLQALRQGLNGREREREGNKDQNRA